jgi:hypothetical protein
LNEITRIDTVTGNVSWRMGGLANQFTFPGGLQPFTRQHGVRIIAPDRIQLLDNLGEPAGSRAEQYRFDESRREASLVGSFSALPPVTALLGGTTQLGADGRILVAYGNGNRVQEYDRSGAVTWQIEGDAGYIFRAQRIHSLYLPGAGSPR